MPTAFVVAVPDPYIDVKRNTTPVVSSIIFLIKMRCLA
jgi:hypothetical protein